MADAHDAEPCSGLLRKVWVCLAHRVAAHLAFLSYRVIADGLRSPLSPRASGAVEAIYAAFQDFDLGGGGGGASIRAPTVFWDAKCLTDGEDWYVGFVSGLMKSSVVLLLVSEGALERMRGADKRVVNLLHEW